MGIKSFYWKKTPTGIVDTEGGLYLTEHDLAKIGFLYLNEEKWDSHPLITAEWVRTSIAEHANPNLRYDPERRYGYGWWLLPSEKKENFAYAAFGAGGQYLFVVPDLKLIVVFTGWNVLGKNELGARTALGRVVEAVTDG